MQSAQDCLCFLCFVVHFVSLLDSRKSEVRKRMKVAVITGLRLPANRLLAPMCAQIYTHTWEGAQMQRGRHKRMKSRCVWAEKKNEESKSKQMGRERNSKREKTKLRECLRIFFKNHPTHTVTLTRTLINE